MTESTVCSICFNNNSVYWIEEYQENNVKFITKLQFVVPEIEWKHNHFICKVCVYNLDSAYEFKDLCIRSLKKLESKKEQGTNCTDSFEEAPFVHDNEHTQSDIEELNDVSQAPEENNLLSSEVSEPKNEEQSCQQCNEDLPERTDFSKHLKTIHKQDNPYACKSCGESFKNKVELVKHEKTHKFTCNICNKIYTSYIFLKKHVLVKHTSRSDWKYNCCYCNELFPLKLNLLVHSKKLHITGEIFVCSHCEAQFDDKNVLLDHIVGNHQTNVNESDLKPKLCVANGETQQVNDDFANPDIKTSVNSENNDKIALQEVIEPFGKKRTPRRSFSCEICGKIFNSSVKLINHCVSEHNLEPKSVKPFACDLCDKRFSTSTILTEHKRYHTRNRQNICSFCGKGFITKNDLNCHEYIHFNERSFKCEICFKGFNTQKNLRTHRIVKHGDPSTWKHCCEICNKRFAILSNYKVHVRRHMGDKQFCCQLCDKKFVNKDELRQHTESHSNIREFKCHLCEKEYKKKRIYEIHLTKVHGIGNAKIPKKEKKHMCHLCPKSYFEKSKLTKHLMTHSGIKPFGCTICDKKFTDNYYLKQHLKNSHGQVMFSGQEEGIVT